MKWRRVGLGLTAVGVVDAVYLVLEFLQGTPPYCPSSGILNCGLVTSSSFSKLLGVPVALLGLVWFALMFGLFLINRESLNYLLIPLWIIGVAGAAYLIYGELFVIHAICIYCTLAHVLGVLTGFPAIKIALYQEPAALEPLAP